MKVQHNLNSHSIGTEDAIYDFASSISSSKAHNNINNSKQQVRNVVMHVVHNGQSLNQKYDPNQNSLLHLAVMHELDDCVDKLLSAGANPCEKNCIGQTPSDIAIDHGNQILLQKLNRREDYWNYLQTGGYRHLETNISSYGDIESCQDSIIDRQSLLSSATTKLLVDRNYATESSGTVEDHQKIVPLAVSSVFEDYCDWNSTTRCFHLKELVDELRRKEKNLLQELKSLIICKGSSSKNLELLRQKLRNKEHLVCMKLWDIIKAHRENKRILDDISKDSAKLKDMLSQVDNTVYWFGDVQLKGHKGFVFEKWRNAKLCVTGHLIYVHVLENGQSPDSVSLDDIVHLCSSESPPTKGKRSRRSISTTEPFISFASGPVRRQFHTRKGHLFKISPEKLKKHSVMYSLQHLEKLTIIKNSSQHKLEKELVFQFRAIESQQCFVDGEELDCQSKVPSNKVTSWSIHLRLVDKTSLQCRTFQHSKVESCISKAFITTADNVAHIVKILRNSVEIVCQLDGRNYPYNVNFSDFLHEADYCTSQKFPSPFEYLTALCKGRKRRCFSADDITVPSHEVYEKSQQIHCSNFSVKVTPGSPPPTSVKSKPGICNSSFEEDHANQGKSKSRDEVESDASTDRKYTPLQSFNVNATISEDHTQSPQSPFSMMDAEFNIRHCLRNVEVCFREQDKSSSLAMNLENSYRDRNRNMGSVDDIMLGVSFKSHGLNRAKHFADYRSPSIHVEMIYDINSIPTMRELLNDTRSLSYQINSKLYDYVTKRERLLEYLHYLQSLRTVIENPPLAPTRSLFQDQLPSMEKIIFMLGIYGEQVDKITLQDEQQRYKSTPSGSMTTSNLLSRSPILKTNYLETFQPDISGRRSSFSSHGSTNQTSLFHHHLSCNDGNLQIKSGLLVEATDFVFSMVRDCSFGVIPDVLAIGRASSISTLLSSKIPSRQLSHAIHSSLGNSTCINNWDFLDDGSASTIELQSDPILPSTMKIPRFRSVNNSALQQCRPTSVDYHCNGSVSYFPERCWHERFPLSDDCVFSNTLKIESAKIGGVCHGKVRGQNRALAPSNNLRNFLGAPPSQCRSEYEEALKIIEQMWNCELESFETAERLAQCFIQRECSWRQLSSLREKEYNYSPLKVAEAIEEMFEIEI